MEHYSEYDFKTDNIGRANYGLLLELETILLSVKPFTLIDICVYSLLLRFSQYELVMYLRMERYVIVAIVSYVFVDIFAYSV